MLDPEIHKIQVLIILQLVVYLYFRASHIILNYLQALTQKYSKNLIFSARKCLYIISYDSFFLNFLICPLNF